MNGRKTKDGFIADARVVHGDKYDYSRVEYVNNKTKVCIVCPEHGEFWQTPHNHLHGQRCPKCGRRVATDKGRYDADIFINKAKEVHGDKYDYSRVEYINSTTKVCIVCPKHGDFWQKPAQHLQGRGCPVCGGKLKKDTETFIALARSVHGNKYDYSKVEYVNNATKVCIVCPEHGEFWQTPKGHLKGNGCISCSGTEPHTTESFIAKALSVHGDQYNYSRVRYVNARTKVCIICPEHGEFMQEPAYHLMGEGCPMCGGRYPLTQETFIRRARQIHGDKYDYSQTEYVRAKDKVCIICPEHGEFWQKAIHHLMGCGCIECAGLLPYSTDSFIEKANSIHGNKYDYSKVEYVNTATKVCISCPEHGEFWQIAGVHLQGAGCPLCNSSKLEMEIRNLLKQKCVCFEEQKGFDWLRDKLPLKLDFYLPDYHVAIECQGSQHFSPSDYFGGYEGFLCNRQRDEKKKSLCEKHGITILYYSNLGIDYPYLVYEDKDELLKAIFQ